MSDTIDGDAVELPADAPAAPEGPGASTELVHHPRVTNDVLVPLDVTQQAAAMQLYQEGLRSILNTDDWQDAGRGESFVKKSGWRKIAAWFNLSVELVRDEVERDEDGKPLRATVWAVAIAPNGRRMVSDGHCALAESRFAKNQQKLENDLRGTAATRAKNRAISDLVGMGAVSAEEVDGPTAAEPYGEPASQDLATMVPGMLAYVLDGDQALAGQVLAKVTEDCGYLPSKVGRAVAFLAAARKAQQQPAADQPQAQDQQDTEPPADAADAAKTTTTKKGK